MTSVIATSAILFDRAIIRSDEVVATVEVGMVDDLVPNIATQRDPHQFPFH